MRSVNSRFGSLCVLDGRVLDGRSAMFALAAFSAGLISMPGFVAPAQAQEESTKVLGTITTEGTATAEVAPGPEVRIIQPQYADQLKGQVQILVGVRANRYAPQTIEMIVDGSAVTGALKMEALPSANFVWDTRKFTDGPHKLTVVVTDAGGFRGTQEVPIYINNKRQKDLSPPALKWMNAKTGETWRGVVNVQLKVVDDFGVKWLFLLLNPASEPTRKPARFSWFLNRPPYNFQIDSRKFEDGRYVLRALAYDALENEGAAPPLTIDIANSTLNPTWISPDSATANALASPKVTAPKTVAPTEDVATPNANIEGDTSTPEVIQPDALASPSANSTIVDPKTAPVPDTSTNANPVTAPQIVQTPAVTRPSFSSPDRATITNREVAPFIAATPGRNGSDNTTSPLMSPSTGDVAESRRTPPESSDANARAATSNDRLAAVDGVQRGGPKGAPVVGYVEGGAREGSVASPQSGANLLRRDGSGKISMPSAAEGRIAAVDRKPVRTNTPSLSPATSDATSRIAAAQPGQVAGASSGGGRLIAPMAPSRLPRIGAAGQPNLSNVPSNSVMAQGSVAAPSPAPLFPNPNLNPTAPRDIRTTPPLMAALPPLAPATRAAKAAITVMPLASAIPAAYVVKRAQTLTAVAKQYKLPVQLLAAANKLPVGASLKAGQKVLLPQPLQVSFEGQPVTGDVASMMMGETGVTPFRFLFEKQGGKLQWDGKNQRVTARNATHQVTLSIGSNTAAVNNKAVMMDLAAFLVSGRTMVPLRFFEKALQARVEWEPTTGRLFVAMAN